MTSYDALLLVSFGGPESPDEVMPFLERVTAGRGVPRERLEAVSHHYLALGGVSPINDQNRALLAALREELDRRDIALPVAWGNRNSVPFLADTLRDLHAQGARRVLAVVTAAYASYSGCRQYREDLAAALDETGLTDLEIDKVRLYADHPGFIEPFVDGVATALARFACCDVPFDGVRLLATTHSIPNSMADAPGRPVRTRRAAAVRMSRSTRRRSRRSSRASASGVWRRRRRASSTSRGAARHRSRGWSPTSTTRSATRTPTAPRR